MPLLQQANAKGEFIQLFDNEINPFMVSRDSSAGTAAPGESDDKLMQWLVGRMI